MGEIAIMQLSAFSDYALRVLMYLAVAGDRQVTVREVAERHRLSRDHVAKVAQFLAREGFVTTARGRSGGMQLARPPAEISIGDVVRRSEAGSGPVECLRNGRVTCAIVSACGLAPLMAEASDAFFASLDAHSLADALPRAGAVRRLLGLAA
jgi:Rrf2 family nitric oxide-sensitive transcriptional repressor